MESWLIRHHCREKSTEKLSSIAERITDVIYQVTAEAVGMTEASSQHTTGSPAAQSENPLRDELLFAIQELESAIPG